MNATEDDIADGIFYRPSYGQSAGQGADTPQNPTRTLLLSLLESGWIDDGGDGSYYLHDWEEWQAEWYKYIGRKDAEKHRKREERDRRRNGGATPIIDPPSDMSVGQSSDTGADSTHLTEQNLNRTEPIQDTTGLPLPPATPSDDGGSAAPTRSAPVPFVKIQDLYNTLCVRLPKIQTIEGKRRNVVSARYKTYGMDGFRLLFDKAAASDFLAGNGPKGWIADFDWIIAASNMPKVLEGKYDNRHPTQGHPPSNGQNVGNRHGVDTLRILDNIITGGEDGYDE